MIVLLEKGTVAAFEDKPSVNSKTRVVRLAVTIGLFTFSHPQGATILPDQVWQNGYFAEFTDICSFCGN